MNAILIGALCVLILAAGIAIGVSYPPRPKQENQAPLEELSVFLGNEGKNPYPVGCGEEDSGLMRESIPRGTPSSRANWETEAEKFDQAAKLIQQRADA